MGEPTLFYPLLSTRTMVSQQCLEVSSVAFVGAMSVVNGGHMAPPLTGPGTSNVNGRHYFRVNLLKIE